MTPIIVGLAGPVLSTAERVMLVTAAPAGVILFARNIIDPVQLRALTDDLRASTGRADLLILIDQEGGTVARLGPPAWPSFPGPAIFDSLYERAPMSAIQAMRANGMAIGAVLAAAGITANCAPMLDLGYTGAAMADRVFGSEPMRVAALGRAMLEGMALQGVTGVMKHMPGHGRALLDSHDALPVITATKHELERDLSPFRAVTMRSKAGMTAHVVYTAWDDARPATLSPVVIDQVIRGLIGFDGLLLSDDLHMNALTGDIADRAAAAIGAGCDLALCCHASVADISRLSAALQPLSDQGHTRLARLPLPNITDAFDIDAAITLRDTFLEMA